MVVLFVHRFVWPFMPFLIRQFLKFADFGKGLGRESTRLGRRSKEDQVVANKRGILILAVLGNWNLDVKSPSRPILYAVA